jgi:hypothetical protein
MKVSEEYTKNQSSNLTIFKTIYSLKRLQYSGRFTPITKENYRYLLTVIDIWSNSIDFEPLKTKLQKKLWLP